MDGDVTKIDFILDQTQDFDGESTSRCYKNFSSMKSYCQDELPRRLKWLEDFLGGENFVAGGSSASIADLKIYETLRKLKIIESQPSVSTRAIESSPKISAFIERVEALPSMKKYMSSSNFLSRPLNNEHAQFK